MRSPGQIVSVVLSRDAHLWQWVIHDSTGVWNGFVEVSVTAPLEEASALLASHVARNWDGQELPGPWEPNGENSWRAGEPPPAAVDDLDDWPRDPTHDWPSVFDCGDVVRLDDGRLAVISGVLNYAPEPPPKWELVVRTLGRSGHLDDTMWPAYACRPAPEAVDEARRQGLF